MDLLTVFISTFALVFVGELGDKTQIAAGTSTLANRRQSSTIFLSSSLALLSVAGLTVFGAGFIPPNLLPTLTLLGGVLLICYGVYLFVKADDPNEQSEAQGEASSWGLFFSQFLVVFLAELGDKTQFATLAAAIKNQSQLFVVFLASALALISVTGLTVWGFAKIPLHWVKLLQRIGAVLMVGYGIYMVVE